MFLGFILFVLFAYMWCASDSCLCSAIAF